MTSFQNFYKEVSRSKNPEIRKNFQFNFPGMIVLVDLKIFSNFRHLFIPLSEDENDIVRNYWVNVVMDVADLIGPQETKNHLSKPLEQQIYLENSRETIETLITNLSRIYKTFFFDKQQNIQVNEKDTRKNGKNSNVEPVTTFLEIITNIFEIMMTINDWRLRKNFQSELEIIRKYLNPNEVFEKYCEMVTKISKEGNIGIKKQCGSMLADFIPTLQSFDKRKYIIRTIYENFYKDANYNGKLFFQYFVGSALKTFSKASQRYFLINQALALSEDKVIGIKVEQAKILPSLYDSILKEDDSIKEKFKNVKKSFDNDSDSRLKDVMFFTNNKISLNSKSRLGDVLWFRARRY